MESDWVFMASVYAFGVCSYGLFRSVMDSRKKEIIEKAMLLREFSEIVGSAVIPPGGTLVLRISRKLLGQERVPFLNFVETVMKDRGFRVVFFEPPFDDISESAEFHEKGNDADSCCDDPLPIPKVEIEDGVSKPG